MALQQSPYFNGVTYCGSGIAQKIVVIDGISGEFLVQMLPWWSFSIPFSYKSFPTEEKVCLRKMKKLRARRYTCLRG